MAYAFEDSVNAQIINCYENVESLIDEVVQDSKYRDDFSSVDQAAEDLRDDLMEKFPWIDWITVAYTGNASSNT